MAEITLRAGFDSLRRFKATVTEQYGGMRNVPGMCTVWRGTWHGTLQCQRSIASTGHATPGDPAG